MAGHGEVGRFRSLRSSLVADGGGDSFVSSLDLAATAHMECLPVLPPTTITLDMYFMRSLYHRMQTLGYYSTEHKGVHITVLRRCMRRLLDMFDTDLVYDFVSFGRHHNSVYISWDDIRFAMENDGMLVVDLHPA
mmetsp:Transcript_87722/g.272650  ORF Transcript_87722/g.272650 Transcript_87722/m.272650 type:complete len:135 (+) Transcript_87722:61-465(+)